MNQTVIKTDSTSIGIYAPLAVVCVGAGAWSSLVSLDTIKHGMAVLETNPAMLALTDDRATMLMAVGLTAWFLVGLLKGKAQLQAHRAMLALFASAVLALEIATIAGVSLASANQAQIAQDEITKQENELLGRIAEIKKDAEANRASADAGIKKATNAYEVHLASKSSDKAEKIKEQTTPLYAELKQLRTQKHTTLTSALGEKFTTIYSIAQGVLMSLGGTFFLSKAGALLRLCYGQDAPQQPNKPAGTRTVQPRSTPKTIKQIIGRVRGSLPPLRWGKSKS